MQACQRDFQRALICEQASLLVVSDGITHGKNGHCLITRCHTPTKRQVCRSTCQSVIGQYGCRGTLLLQNLKCSTMEDAPAGISSSDIRYFANLVVGKHVRNGLYLSA